MFDNNRILALVTARGGSKGIPRKNVKPLAGKPLISWTIQAARGSKYIDRLILSSEDEEIIRVAKAAGCDVPFVRPVELAEDDSSSMDVIEHALSSLDEEYDYLLLLQPTSPFRSSSDIDGIIEYTFSKKADFSVSVQKCKKHPMYMYEIEGNSLKPVMGYFEQLRRQDTPPVYEYNGALYFSKISRLLETKSYNTPGVLAYVTEGYVNIDIDTQEDWIYAECVASKIVHKDGKANS